MGRRKTQLTPRKLSTNLIIQVESPDDELSPESEDNTTKYKPKRQRKKLPKKIKMYELPLDTDPKVHRARRSHEYRLRCKLETEELFNEIDILNNTNNILAKQLHVLRLENAKLKAENSSLKNQNNVN